MDLQMRTALTKLYFELLPLLPFVPKNKAINCVIIVAVAVQFRASGSLANQPRDGRKSGEKMLKNYKRRAWSTKVKTLSWCSFFIFRYQKQLESLKETFIVFWNIVLVCIQIDFKCTKHYQNYCIWSWGRPLNKKRRIEIYRKVTVFFPYPVLILKKRMRSVSTLFRLLLAGMNKINCDLF